MFATRNAANIQSEESPPKSVLNQEAPLALPEMVTEKVQKPFDLESYAKQVDEKLSRNKIERGGISRTESNSVEKIGVGLKQEE